MHASDWLSVYSRQESDPLMAQWLSTLDLSAYPIEQLPPRQTADGAVTVQPLRLKSPLGTAARQALLARLLPQVRQLGLAVYLRRTDAAPIRRIVADLDGTLVADELLVVLSRGGPYAEQMSRMTEAAMSGNVDFAESFAERIRRLKGLPVATLEALADSMALAPGVASFCHFAHEEGIRLDIASSNLTPYVRTLCKRLGADGYIATRPRLNNSGEKLTGALEPPIITAQEKCRYAEKMLPGAREESAQGYTPQGTLTIGDGANDLEMLSATGHALLYPGANSRVSSLVHITQDVYLL